ASTTTSGEINLKPTEFSTGGKSAAQTPEPAPTPTPAPVTESPTATGVSTDTDEVDLPVEERSEKEDVTYFPAGGLGKEKSITRGGHQIAMRPELLEPAPLNATVPDVYATTFTNGLKFYHLPSHDLPRVRVTLLINAGSNFDTADKVGLAELMVRTLRSGGAAGKSGDEIDQ